MAAVVESCENCKFFLLVVKPTGKGVCRFEPPKTADDKNQTPTKDDGNGRRWPVCWNNEWCGKWVKVTT